MPMTMAQAMASEFEREAASTRKALERVPDEQFDWQPHQKSMSLRRLAGHLAEIPRWASDVLDHNELDFSKTSYEPTLPETRDELLEVFDRNTRAFLSVMADRADEELFETWVMRSGDTVHAEMPRVAALRSFVLSHWIHHRGQLSVYLRLLEVPVPGTYGPTADEPGF